MAGVFRGECGNELNAAHSGLDPKAATFAPGIAKDERLNLPAGSRCPNPTQWVPTFDFRLISCAESDLA